MPKRNLENKEQFRAWKEGAVCRCKNFRLSDNPYPSRSAKGDAWEEGWETIDHQLPVPDIGWGRLEDPEKSPKPMVLNLLDRVRAEAKNTMSFRVPADHPDYHHAQRTFWGVERAIEWVNKQTDGEDMGISKDLLQKWVNQLDSFEWEVNRHCATKEQMEEYLKNNQMEE